MTTSAKYEVGKCEQETTSVRFEERLWVRSMRESTETRNFVRMGRGYVLVLLRMNGKV